MTTLGIVAAFLLAIYGGLYSGGYVTVLTAAFVAFLGMTYGGAIAATKLIRSEVRNEAVARRELLLGRGADA